MCAIQNGLPPFPLLELRVRYEEGVWSLRLSIEYVLGVSPGQPFISYEGRSHLMHELRSLGFGITSEGIVSYSALRCERCGYLETPEVDGDGRHCLLCHGEIIEPEVGEESLAGTKIFQVNLERTSDLIRELCGLLDALPQL